MAAVHFALTTTRHENRDSFVDLGVTTDEIMPRMGRNDYKYPYGTLQS